MSWNERERLATRIERLFQDASRLTSVDMDRLQADIARYLCVLTSGYIEASCRDILGSFARANSSDEVYRFVSRKLDRLPNPCTEDVLTLVDSFVDGARESIEQLPDFDELKDAVNSVVSNRNQIAHGRDTGISLATMQDYYQRVKRFIQLIERAVR